MNPLLQRSKRLTTILIGAIVLAIIGWAVSLFSPIFAGIVLGLWFGFISTIYTAFKVHRMSQAVVDGSRRTGLGTGVRFALAAIGTLLALRFPEYIHVIGFAAGLFLTQVFVLGDAIYSQLKNNET